MSFGIAGIYNTRTVYHVNAAYGRTDTSKADDVAAVEAAEGLKELHGRLVTHCRQIESLHETLTNRRAATRTRKSATVSFQDDDLSASASTYSTLTSTEEINTTPTSYDDRGEFFDGSTTSIPTVGGIYDGRYGTDTLEFRVRRDRTFPGTKTVRLDIYDSSGSYLENIKWSSGTPADTEKTTDSGLTVSLSAGDLYRNDSFFVDVYDSVGTDIEVDNPFDGTRNDHPELEDGYAITDGSFDLNGVSINVYADDSLQDVMDRINTAGAGATVALEGDKLVFTAEEPGAEDIVIDSDTSGFVDAMKLSTAVVDYGNTSGADMVIEDVDALDGISTGTFSINGTLFSVDISSDTLGDMIDSINAAELGVTATLGEDGRFTLSAGTGAMTLDSGTSNFFSAMNIQDGVHQGKRGRLLTAQEAHAMTDAMEQLSESFQAMFDELERGPDSTAEPFRKSIAAAVQGYFTDGNGNTVDRFGLELDFDEDIVWELDHGARTDFYEALMTEGPDVLGFLLGDENIPGQEIGFLDALKKRVGLLDDSLSSSTSYQGLLVSTYA